MQKLVQFALTTTLFVFSAATASAQSAEGLHMEACTEWRSFDGSHYTRNACRRTLTVWFMTLDGQNRMERRLERNEPLDTGISSERARDLGWIGATCPVGFRPDIEFGPQNKDRFLESDYDCVR